MKLTQELARAWRRLLPRRKGSIIVTGVLLLLVGVLVTWDALTPEQPAGDGNVQVGGIVEDGSPQLADGVPLETEGTPDLMPPAGEVMAEPTDEVDGAPEPEAEPATPEIDPADISWQRPVKANPVQDYGIAYHPVHDDYRLHGGWTYSLLPETPVAAAAEGTVVDIQPAGAMGWEVWIDHGGGLQTAYNGLGSVSVAVGDPVDAGTVLGAVGQASTASLGQALFFAMVQDGEPLDPAEYVR